MGMGPGSRFQFSFLLTRRPGSIKQKLKTEKRNLKSKLNLVSRFHLKVQGNPSESKALRRINFHKPKSKERRLGIKDLRSKFL